MDLLFKLSLKNLAAITHIDLKTDSFGFDSRIRWVNRFPKIKTLSLIFAGTYRNNAVHLSGIKPMETVTLLKTTSIDLLEDLRPKLPNLKKIHLTVYKVSDVERLKNVAEKIPTLLEIHLSEALFTEPNIVEKLQKMKIKLLNMSFSEVSMDVIESFSKCHPSINDLEINCNLYSTFISELVRFYPNLWVLGIGTINLASWPIENIFEDIAKSKIKILKIITNSQDIKLSNKVIRAPSLDELRLQSQDEKSGFEIDSFGLALQCCANLTRLEVTLKIFDAHLQLIIRHLTKLKLLKLDCCANLTDNGFSSIKALSFLEDLDLENGTNITDRGFGFFRFNRLRKFRVKNSPKITFEGVKTVKMNCPFVRTLVLEEVPRISLKQQEEL